MTPNNISSQELWADFIANPDTHTNIPNCSYAGYRYSEKPLPKVRAVTSVAEHGARGDGEYDDTAAFKAAIAQANDQGGGAIEIPNGEYLLTESLKLSRSGTVLRGESRDGVRLFFKNPLMTCVDDFRSANGTTQWSWLGGLIWVGPESTFGGDGLPIWKKLGDQGQGWEHWREVYGESGLPLVGHPQKGEFVIEVQKEGEFKAGDYVILHYTNPEDHSLFSNLCGAPLMEKFWTEEYSGPRFTGASWMWAVEVAKVEGARLSLKQPLRVAADERWQVKAFKLQDHIEEVGVESLTIAFPDHERQDHCMDHGYNGIYLNRVIHGWVKDVVVENSDAAVHTACSKNTTVSGLISRGIPHHHYVTHRSFAQDNLLTDFRIESEAFHGLNVEGLANGNVYRRGHMEHGTFDPHRGLPFDNIRTDITLANHGRNGGADGLPYQGARCVNWNLRITSKGPLRPFLPKTGDITFDPGDYVYQPDLYSDSALVGIQGAELSTKSCMTPWKSYDMVPGDKNCLIADHDREPEIKDLFQAQLENRLS